MTKAKETATNDEKEKRTNGPRQAFVTFKGTDDESTKVCRDFQEMIQSGRILLPDEVSRKADALLEVIQRGEVDGYVRIMVK